MSEPSIPTPAAVPLLPWFCASCGELIEPNPRRKIFVIVGAKAGPGAGIILDTAAAVPPEIFTDDILPFGSVICLKKWLLQWVDNAAAWNAKVQP